MTDTPETDAFYNGPCRNLLNRRQRDFACRLERQRNEALRDLAACRVALDQYRRQYEALHAQRMADEEADAIKAAFSGQGWTTESPKTGGWWWWKAHAEGGSLVLCVTRHVENGKEYIMAGHPYGQIMVETMKERWPEQRWAGPLQSPLEPQ